MMNVVIFCGGKGTRLGKTEDLPKPLVKIDKKYPILRHLMMNFAKQGFDNFTLLCGHRIDEFYRFKSSWMIPARWKVNILDTGEETQTGGRVYQYMQDNPHDTFFLTYGDGLSTVNMCAVYQTHIANGKPVTITAVHPPSRFGLLDINGRDVVSFSEKPTDSGWINGGFMILESSSVKRYYSHIQDKNACNLEKDIFPLMANDNQITAYKHTGFWQCMDTPRDVEYLRELRKSKKWKAHFG